MTDFTDFDEALAEFFEEFGFEATYLKNGNSYNSTTLKSTQTVTEITVEAILLDLTLQSNGLSTKFGTLVLAGDKELYIRPPNKTDSSADPLAINPSTDKIRVNGVDYKIITMKEINTTSSEPLVFDLYIRR